MNGAEYRTVMARTMLEADLQSQVIAIAKTFGWLCFHPRNMLGSEAGWPDLTMVRNGRLIFAELKREAGKTTPAQDKWLAELKTTGADTFLWRPSDLIDGTIPQVLL